MCDCHVSRACGNPPPIRVHGSYYQPPHHKAFAHWDGQLARNDLVKRRRLGDDAPPLPYTSSSFHSLQRPCHDRFSLRQSCMAASGASQCMLNL